MSVSQGHPVIPMVRPYGVTRRAHLIVRTGDCPTSNLWGRPMAVLRGYLVTPTGRARYCSTGTFLYIKHYNGLNNSSSQKKFHFCPALDHFKIQLGEEDSG